MTEIPGGLDNKFGMHCSLNVVLQDFASDSVYDRMTNPNLNDSPELKPLRDKVRECVQKIRLGQTVPNQDTLEIRRTLTQLNYQEDLGILNFFYLVLFRCFGIYPPMDARNLYVFLREKLGNTEIKYNETDLCWRETGSQNEIVINNIHGTQTGTKLTKYVDPDQTYEHVKNGQSLTQIHQIKTYCFGLFAHTLIHRKVDGRWFRINDDKVTEVSLSDLPRTNLSMLVYSAPLPVPSQISSLRRVRLSTTTT